MNEASSTEVSYEIGGLPKNRSLELVVWNRGGGGKLVSDTVPTDANGVGRVDVPRQAAFALTTLPVPL